MKPRLQVADYTHEDQEAWFFLRCHIQKYRPGYAMARRLARDADRRDADLMLSLMMGCRAFLVYPDIGPNPPRRLVFE